MTKKQKNIILIFTVLLLLAIAIATVSGAVKISFDSFLVLLGFKEAQANELQQIAVLTNIRLPRVLLAILVGFSLSVSGAAVQGVFRNPLADPSLIGITAGAALFAAFYIILIADKVSFLPSFFQNISLSMFSFFGAILATIFVFKIGRVNGKTAVSIMLLAGIAINALAGALNGLMVYVASDEQLRSLTFWTLGSLAGANWGQVFYLAPISLVSVYFLIKTKHSLNALSLGESQAMHIGLDVEKLNRKIIFFSAIAVGSSVALTGAIGFVGLVVPHFFRMIGGASHLFVLPASVIGGAFLLLTADTIARTIIIPAELPIGIITALIGAPFFLYIMIKNKNSHA
jgi:iron complex transport system permease protein